MPPGSTDEQQQIDIQIGQNLRAARVMRGWSQGQLGEALGVSFQQVQKYETGGNRLSGSRMVQIALAWKTDIRFLFTGLGVCPGISGAPILSRQESSALAAFRAIPGNHKKALLHLLRAMVTGSHES